MGKETHLAEPADFRTIISEWPSPDDLAADTKAKPDAVRKWIERNSVPSQYFEPMLAAAKKRRISVTATDLVSAAARRI